ncbi:hypothetical protein KL939_000107 [Ogataea angusta]|nr:hypothetical protein KL939_000107 [Ogataea angusta]
MDAVRLRIVDDLGYHQGHVEGGGRQVRVAADGREHQQDLLFDVHFSPGVFPHLHHRRRSAGCEQHADVQLSDQQQNHERVLQRLRKHGVVENAADPRERARFKPDLQQQAVRGGHAHERSDQELLTDVSTRIHLGRSQDQQGICPIGAYTRPGRPCTPSGDGYPHSKKVSEHVWPGPRGFQA